MKRKILSLLLVALLCLTAVMTAACGENDDGSSQAVSRADTQSDEFVSLHGEKNWGGQTVRLITHNQHTYSTAIIPEQLTNEPVNDAFYERNQLIAQNYGIVLELEECDSPNAGIDRVRNDIESGANDIQIIALPLTYIAPLGASGLLLDFNDAGNDYLSLDKPWWDQTMIRDLTLRGKTWFLAGDALVEDDEATWAVYFNKDLVESYRLESPYQLVKDGKWTLDKMYEMAKTVHYVEGDKMEFDHTSGDTWGIIVQSYDCYALMLGAGQKMIENDGQNLSFRVNTEENVSTFQKVMDMVLDGENCGVADFYGRWDQGIYQEEFKVFANGHSLFMPYTISTVSESEMRESAVRFGILPMPKANENVDDYTTSVTCYWCEVLSVPKTNEELKDVTCYALEAMAYYGMQKVTPEYYTRTLTHKRFYDAESEEMLDLIFRNRVYDLAGVFNFGSETGSGTLGFYTNLLWARSADVISSWASQADHFQAAVNEFVSSLSE